MWAAFAFSEDPMIELTLDGDCPTSPLLVSLFRMPVSSSADFTTGSSRLTTALAPKCHKCLFSQAKSPKIKPRSLDRGIAEPHWSELLA